MTLQRHTSRITRAGLLALGALASCCSSPTPGSTPAPPSLSPPVLKLWGDMKPVVSVKELMRDMIDPLADNIFDAIGTVADAKGVVQTAPKTDEDWQKIRM